MNGQGGHTNVDNREQKLSGEEMFAVCQRLSGVSGGGYWTEIKRKMTMRQQVLQANTECVRPVSSCMPQIISFVHVFL